MAALLGTNTAIMLFQGMEQEANPTPIREVALTIIAATLPFQAIYFLIYTFLLENNGRLSHHMVKMGLKISLPEPLRRPISAFLKRFEQLDGCSCDCCNDEE